MEKLESLEYPTEISADVTILLENSSSFNPELKSALQNVLNFIAKNHNNNHFSSNAPPKISKLLQKGKKSQDPKKAKDNAILVKRGSAPSVSRSTEEAHVPEEKNSKYSSKPRKPEDHSHTSDTEEGATIKKTNSNSIVNISRNSKKKDKSLEGFSFSVLLDFFVYDGSFWDRIISTNDLVQITCNSILRKKKSKEHKESKSLDAIAGGQSALKINFLYSEIRSIIDKSGFFQKSTKKKIHLMKNLAHIRNLTSSWISPELQIWVKLIEAVIKDHILNTIHLLKQDIDVFHQTLLYIKASDEDRANLPIPSTVVFPNPLKKESTLTLMTYSSPHSEPVNVVQTTSPPITNSVSQPTLSTSLSSISTSGSFPELPDVAFENTQSSQQIAKPKSPQRQRKEYPQGSINKFKRSIYVLVSEPESDLTDRTKDFWRCFDFRLSDDNSSVICCSNGCEIPDYTIEFRKIKIPEEDIVIDEQHSDHQRSAWIIKPLNITLASNNPLERLQCIQELQYFVLSYQLDPVKEITLKLSRTNSIESDNLSEDDNPKHESKNISVKLTSNSSPSKVQTTKKFVKSNSENSIHKKTIDPNKEIHSLFVQHIRPTFLMIVELINGMKTEMVKSRTSKAHLDVIFVVSSIQTILDIQKSFNDNLKGKSSKLDKWFETDFSQLMSKLNEALIEAKSDTKFDKLEKSIEELISMPRNMLRALKADHFYFNRKKTVNHKRSPSNIPLVNTKSLSPTTTNTQTTTTTTNNSSESSPSTQPKQATNKKPSPRKSELKIEDLSPFRDSDGSTNASKFIEKFNQQVSENYNLLEKLDFSLIRHHAKAIQRDLSTLSEENVDYLYSPGTQITAQLGELNKKFLSLIDVCNELIFTLEAHLSFCQSMLENVHLDSFSERTLNLSVYFKKHREKFDAIFADRKNIPPFPFKVPHLLSQSDHEVEIKNEEDYDRVRDVYLQSVPMVDKVDSAVPTKWPQTLPNLSTHNGKPTLTIANSKDFSIICQSYWEFIRRMDKLRESWSFSLRMLYQFLDGTKSLTETNFDHVSIDSYSTCFLK
eukprot:TRINITY_DN10375_c0_g1_i1.p1 TRINITY_DN10375_c0_g1~~TRINITY_DN10375_c0_g1_i1.p1  ORF type:complete len:1063 (-),score=202.92 TRINITY_DN10375_c0_g1_i1:49-3207(-)